jgi:hypothetical protein
MASSTTRGTDVITPVATLCYSHLSQTDENGKYRVELVFSPEDVVGAEAYLMDSLVQASKDLVAQVWPGKTKGKRTGIITGEQTSTDDELHNNAAGIIRPWSKPRNGECTVKFKHVGDRETGRMRLMPHSDVSSVFYDGCQVRAVVCPFSFSTEGNSGVSWFLNQLIFVSEGTRIGGAGSSEMDARLAEICGVDLDEEGSVESLL